MKNGWVRKLKELIPSYGQSITDDPALCERIRAETAEVLGLAHLKIGQLALTAGDD
jgi:malate dehydrogenase (quinone)